MRTRRREIRKTKTTEKKETDPGVQEGNATAEAKLSSLQNSEEHVAERNKWNFGAVPLS